MWFFLWTVHYSKQSVIPSIISDTVAFRIMAVRWMSNDVIKRSAISVEIKIRAVISIELATQVTHVLVLHCYEKCPVLPHLRQFLFLAGHSLGWWNSPPHLKHELLIFRSYTISFLSFYLHPQFQFALDFWISSDCIFSNNSDKLLVGFQKDKRLSLLFTMFSSICFFNI